MAHSATLIIKRLIIAFVILETRTCLSYLNEMQKACPYTDFCTVPALIENNNTDDSINCCSPCSCESDCWTWDNCCPDVIHEKPVDLQSANCIPMFVNQSFYNKAYSDSYQSYQVIDFCPHAFTDKRIVNQCDGKFDEPVDFTDVVAVSDAKHRIYKNKYCASCNGELDVVSWKLAMEQCPKDLSLAGPDFTQSILKNCPLVALPPNQYNYQMACGSTVYDTCPGSASLAIRQGCHNGPYMPYIDENVTFQFEIFKNVFCFLCKTNSEQLREATKACSKKWEKQIRAVKQPFRVLIDPMVYHRHAMLPEASTTCLNQQIYDHKQRKCVTYFCPTYSVAVNGVCQSLGTLTGARIALTILLIPTKRFLLPKDIPTQENEQSRKYIANYLHRYGLGSCDILWFAIRVLVEKQNDVLYCMISEIEILLDEKCSRDIIAGMVRNHLSSYHAISLKINTFDIHLMEQISFYAENDEVGVGTIDHNLYREVMWALWYPDGVLVLNSLGSDFFICPYFVLDVHQYNSIFGEINGKRGNQTELSMITRLADGFYALSNDKIAACVDTYFDLYKSSGGQPGRSTFSWVLTTISIAIYAKLMGWS